MVGCTITKKDIRTKIDQFFEEKGDSFIILESPELKELFDKIVGEFKDTKWSDKVRDLILNTFKSQYFINEYINLGLESEIETLLDNSISDIIETLEIDDSITTDRDPASKIDAPVYIGSLETIVGKSTFLRTFVIHGLSLDIVRSLIFDQDKRIIVKRSLANKNIAKLKNRLYKTLKLFLSEQSDFNYKELLESLPKEIYKLNGEVNEYWDRLLTLALKYLFGENFNGSEELIKTVVDKMLSEDNQDKLEAYRCFTILSPKIFDSLLSDEILKNNISIKTQYKTEVNLKFNKYSLVDESSFHGINWSNEENDEALSKLNRMVELLLETTPMLNYNSGRPNGLFLDASQVLYFFNEVRKRVKNTDVLFAFNNLHLNPLKHITTIVQYCALNNLAEVPVGLRHIARTLWDTFFDKSNKKSLYNITLLTLSATDKDCGLIDYLASMINRSYQMKYMFYGSNEERTGYGVLEISPVNHGRYSGQVKAKMENNLNLNPDFSILDTYLVEYSKDNSGKLYKSNVSFKILLQIPGRLILDDEGDITRTVNGEKKTYRKIEGGKKTLLFSFDPITSNLKISDPDDTSIKYTLSDLIGELPGNFFELYRTDKSALSDGNNYNAIQLLTLIDRLLRTDFLTGEERVFDYLRSEVTNSDSIVEPIADLLELVNNALSIIKLRLEYDNEKIKLKKANKTLEFNDFISAALDLNSKDNSQLYNFYDPIRKKMKITRSSGEVVRKLTNAVIVAEGDYFKGTVKGVDSNAIAKYRKPSLAGRYEYLINRLKKLSVYKYSTLSRTPGLISDVFVLNGADYNGEFKISKEFTPGDWNYSSFMYDFVSSVFTEESKYYCLPVTYSDKTTFYKYVFDLKKLRSVWLNGNEFKFKKEIKDLDNETLRKAVWINRSLSYKSIYKKVNNNTWAIINHWLTDHDDPDFLVSRRDSLTLTPQLLKRVNNVIDKISAGVLPTTYEDLRALMHLINQDEINFLAGKHNIDASENLYFIKVGNVLDTNVSLHYMANVLFNAKEIEENPNSTYTLYVNSLLKRSCGSLLKLNLNFNDADLETLLSLFKNQYGIKSFLEWFKGNVFVLAKTKTGIDITSPEILNRYDSNDIIFNPLFEKWILVDMLTSFDLRLLLVGTEMLHPNKERGDIQTQLHQGYNSESETLAEDMFDLVRLQVNLFDLSSAKRTVNIGATISSYTMNSRIGIPRITRRAIMYDPKAPVFGPMGKDKNIDAHDGGSLGLMLEMVLRNLSLEGDKIAGTISKSIEIDYTPSGALLLDKYALHGMDNWKIRNSQGSKYNLLNLTRRMMSIRFFDENGDYYNFDDLDKIPDNVGDYTLDLTTDYFGKKILLSLFTNDNLYYYDTKTNKIYKIVAFERTGSSPTDYIIKRITINQYGEEASLEEEVPVKINCLYDLWLAFGGLYSMQKINGKLLYTDASWYVLANYVNSVGKYTGEYNGAIPSEIPDQTNVWQPLKHKYIATLDVKSAVKNGAYAINSVAKWEPVEREYKRDSNGEFILDENNEKVLESDEEYLARLESDLSYVVQDTSNSGELLDAAHILEDGEIDVTLPTLVVAALENGGYSHDVTKRIYSALGLLALNKINDDVPSVLKIYELLDPKGSSDYDAFKSEAYEVLGIIGVRAARKDEFGSLRSVVEQVQQELKKHRKDHKDDTVKLPLSDSSIFMKIVADYISNINKVAIKHKQAGFAAVISPSYGMLQLYRLPDGNFTYEEVERKAITYFKNDKVIREYSPSRKIRLYLDKVFEKQEFKPISCVTPGLNIIVCDESGVPISDTASGSYIRYNTQEWEQYLELKDKYGNGGYTFKVDLWTPSDLMPMTCTWGNNLMVHNYYDIPFIRTVFNIQNSKQNLTIELKRLIRDMVLKVLNILHEGKLVPITVFEKTNAEKKNNEIKNKVVTLTDDLELADSIGIPVSIEVRDKLENETVNVKDAELMVPNLYAKKFGMSEYDSLSRVLTYGPDFFKRKYFEKHKIASKTAYNLCLTKSNGEHVYIVLKDSFLYGKLPLPNTTDDDYKRKRNKEGNDSLVRINEDGETLYNAGYFDKDGNQVKTIEEYISDDGNIVYVIDDFNDLDQFLTDFDDIRINGRVDIDTSAKFAEHIANIQDPNPRVTKFQTMCATIKKAYDLIKKTEIDRGLSEEVSKKKIEKRFDFYKDTIDSLMKLLLDELIISKNKSKPVRDLIVSYFEDTKDKRGLLNNTLSKADRTRLVNYLFNDIYRLIFAKTSELIIDDYANRKFASFLKSLEYVAARIPAQTLQSFMKMQVVAFVPGKVNNAYVSHYLTWLLGSDYDIDKSYLMGHEFSSYGNYITHSPLAVTDSFEGILLSETVPIPDLNVVFKKSEIGVDITDELNKLSKDKLNNLRIYINILNKAKNGEVKFEEDLKEKGEEVIKLLNNHNQYFTTKPYKHMLSILNNIATNGILEVISSVQNFRLSHTPITLGNKDDRSTPKGASVVSELGLDSNDMTLTLITDRNELTTHNLVGRNVIGIAAIGAKLFFNMSYALNELIRTKSKEELRKVMYRFRFNPKIYLDGKLLQIDIVRHILPNINFDLFEDKKDLVIELIEKLESKYYSKTDIQHIIENEFDLQPDQALIISELLSAATDNAKELILSKINATDLTAGLYIHLLVLGYDFKEIAQYMTSSIVSEIVKLAERLITVFNPTSSKSRNLLLNTANALLGDINIWRFLDSYDEVKSLSSRLKLSKTKDLKAHLVLEDYLAECIKQGIPLNVSGISNKNVLSLLNYVNSLVNLKIKFNLLYKDNAEANKLIEFFTKLVQGAQETTLIGKVLSCNLGMRTNPTELLTWIQSVENGVTDNLFDAKRIKLQIKAAEDKSAPLPANEYFSISEAEKIIEEAEKYDIIYNFNFNKFMLDGSEYRLAAIDYYALVKKNHNLLYIIESLPNVKRILLIFASTNELFTGSMATYRVLSPMYKTMNRMKIPISIEKRTVMERFVLKLFILLWLKQTKNVPNITLQEGDMYFDNKGVRRYVEEGDTYKLDFSKIQDIATFKFYMENYVLRKLLLSLGLNEFVKNLIVDDGRKDLVTLDPINTLIIRDLNLRSKLLGNKQIRYERILSDFAKLGNFSIDGNNVIELFALYNLIVNQNVVGLNNLTKLIFDTMGISGINIKTLSGDGGWFKFIGSDLDYDDNATFDINTLIDNLMYYISDKRNWRSKTQYDRDNRRNKVIAKYYNKSGETVTYDYATDLDVARDMSNYFMLDTPFSRLISDTYTDIFDVINNKIDAEFLADAYSKNIIKIAYYCE